MSAPRFSVVIAAHDAAATIESAVTSVQRQSTADFETIVVDDGSSDDTAARVERLAAADPRVRLVRRDNGGPSAARNSGIAVARGEFVCTLDSDDLWLPRYLETMADALDGSDAGFACTDAWVLDDATGRIRRRTAMARARPPATLPASARGLLLLLLDRNVVYTSVTVRREALAHAGGYDERLWTAEDYELWVRLAAHGYAAVRVPATLAVHRDRPGSLTTDLPRLVAGRAEVYRIVAEEYDVSDEVVALALRRRAHWESVLADLRLPPRARSNRARARSLAGRLRRRALGRTDWLSTPPPEVSATLQAVAAARSRHAESTA